MLSRAAALALVGSAAAFNPMMSMDVGRRQVVQAGAAAAAAAPLLRAQPAEAVLSSKLGLCKNGKADGACNAAPIITIFDHRGCQRGGPNSEYRGKQAGDQDDEMLVKVELQKIAASESRAAAQLAESISFTQKGIDGDYHKVRNPIYYKP
eukprot:Tamp_32057.p3 GENE.Tamp_32057~~Tamp_32057.p3  ORF type:complete len:151 (-),score=54.39 Tamp_32057:147-599(-)